MPLEAGARHNVSAKCSCLCPCHVFPKVREAQMVEKAHAIENLQPNRVGKQLVFDVLQASFLPGNVSSIALASNLKRKQVRIAHKAGALVHLERQREILKRIRSDVEIGKLSITIFIDRLEADISKQRLQVGAHPLLSTSQQRSAWDMCVVLWEALWLDDQSNVCTIGLVLVPVVAVGKIGA